MAPGCGLDEVIGVAERLPLALLEEPVQTRNGTIEISASCGVTSSTQFHNVDAETLIQAADEALYQAKDSGRNCVQVAGSVSRLAGKTPVILRLHYRLGAQPAQQSDRAEVSVGSVATKGLLVNVRSFSVCLPTNRSLFSDTVRQCVPAM